jgi:3-hydroxybutyryl-CoA dehydratase
MTAPSPKRSARAPFAATWLGHKEITDHERGTGDTAGILSRRGGSISRPDCFHIGFQGDGTMVGTAAMQPGTTESLEFSVSPEDMHAFRRLSGDTNPLHDDRAFAMRRGFKGIVVYGSLIVAQVSRLLGTVLPGPGCVWHSLSLRFRNPLYVGVPARLYGTVTYANDSLGLLKLALRVEAAGRLIADGEAAAQLTSESRNARAADAMR